MTDTPAPLIEWDQVEETRLTANLLSLAERGREVICVSPVVRSKLMWMIFHKPAEPLIISGSPSPLQVNLAEAWQALSAMRDTINEHIPLPSSESDLLTGPEFSVSCEAVATAIVTYTLRAKERIRLADELIKGLQDHEGAEGWSADLYTKLSTYDIRYWLNGESSQSPTAAPVTIEGGKYYETRDGKIIGPMMPYYVRKELKGFRAYNGEMNFVWWPDGSAARGTTNPGDLIKEAVWRGPGTEPHDYEPCTPAMGDCAICGHTQEAHTRYKPRGD